MKARSLPWAPLLSGEDLPDKKWEEIFDSLFRGAMPAAAIKSVILLLAKRENGSTQLRNCLKVLRRLEPVHPIRLSPSIDLCGSGGDEMKTFNISTISAFVIAASGGYVAKHGNRAVSSKVGSSDLVEALGIDYKIPFKRMLQALGRFNFSYFHAPLYHPSFRPIQGIRRELGVRTLFNFVGPLLNPLKIDYQMIGISDPLWLEPVAKALILLKRKRAAVFHAADGLDELSTGASNRVLLVEGGRTKFLRLNPRSLAFRPAGLKDLRGGGRSDNVRIAKEILQGKERGRRRDIVLLNSGFALWLMELAGSIEEGILKARTTLETGRAWAVVRALQQFTHRKPVR